MSIAPNEMCSISIVVYLQETAQLIDRKSCSTSGVLWFASHATLFCIIKRMLVHYNSKYSNSD